MNKITINHGTFQVDERILEHGVITLGRTTDNDVQMDDDTVSAHHAKIVTVFTASHVEDLGSTNGTFVNGKRVIKHTLHSGDIITTGGYQIVFYSDQGAPKKAPEKTEMMSNNRIEAMIAASASASASDAEQQTQVKPDYDLEERESLSGDTVLVMDDETDMQTDMDTDSSAHDARRNKQNNQNRYAEMSEIQGALEASERRNSKMRSLYITVAVTVVVVIALIAILISL